MSTIQHVPLLSAVTPGNTICITAGDLDYPSRYTHDIYWGPISDYLRDIVIDIQFLCDINLFHICPLERVQLQSAHILQWPRWRVLSRWPWLRESRSGLNARCQRERFKGPYIHYALALTKFSPDSDYFRLFGRLWRRSASLLIKLAGWILLGQLGFEICGQLSSIFLVHAYLYLGSQRLIYHYLCHITF